MSKERDYTGFEIAVIGMAGRFPGAKNIGEFWENLKNGRESISFFSEEELLEAGVENALLENSDYVRANGILEDTGYFDSAFFDYTDAEAVLMDPQMRIFHECAWAGLEDAGYCPDLYNGLIGLFAGACANFNWEAMGLFSSEIAELGMFSGQMLMDKDFLGGWVSYKLDLKGPAFTLTTACSTSLVAIHAACQSILNGECDIALSGGVGINLLNKQGYLNMEGFITSGDGHVRTFDERSNGIIRGEGAAVVVLKRLEEAVKDRDHIYALVKGSAINNDGVQKVGFTAPSIEGQARVIRAALEMAEVEPETIGYIETHGTATEMGDPVEVQGLTLAFNTGKRKYCRIGSVKTNIGHLDAAAGAAGFIKAVLSVKYGLIPANLHFIRPNPKIDFENSPFYVNAGLSEWKEESNPRRAGVSSFGIGGTNGHVILEEAPPPEFSSQSRSFQLLLLSAKTTGALDRTTKNLALYLEKNPGVNLADAAYTLQTGRKGHQYRRMTVCSGREEAVRSLSSPGRESLTTNRVTGEKRSLVFMFSGQGSQYINMGRDIYNREPQFREEVDRCFQILESLSGVNFKEILYPSTEGMETAEEKIIDIRYSGPIKLLFEYSLAKLLMKWGITPQAMIGHSFGEYTAASLAGVFSLEDALQLSLIRGMLMKKTPDGAMTGVPLSEEKLKSFLDRDLSIAAVNAPELCIASGALKSIRQLEKQLEKMGNEYLRINFPRASHSKMMVPILEEFTAQFAKIKLNKPKIPYISGLTGNWITGKQAGDPDYWAKHMTDTIRFADGISFLIKELDPIFIHPGADRGLPLFVNHNPLKKEKNEVVNMIRHSKEKEPDLRYLSNKIGHLWISGAGIDWGAFYNSERRNRIPLPAYSFELSNYPDNINLNEIANKFLTGKSLLTHRKKMTDWFYLPVWEQSFTAKEYTPDSLSNSTWMVFSTGKSPGEKIVDRLRRQVENTIVVKPGEAFEKTGELEFTVNPRNPVDYDALLRKLSKIPIMPQRILHLWNFDENKNGKTSLAQLDLDQDMSLYSLLNLVKALGNRFITDDLRIDIVTRCMQDVTGEEELFPTRATILGAVKIIPLEYRNIFCRSIDMEIDTPLDLLMRELSIQTQDKVVALRGNHRWLQNIKSIPLEETATSNPHLEEKGVYLITGGLGGLGFTFARYLAQNFNARLILIDTSEFPPREKWDIWIDDNGEEDSVSRKITAIRELEKKDAEILLYNADVSDYPAMERIIEEAEKQTGRINGVIHTAGLLDYEGAIQNRTREMTEKLLKAKVKGTLVLDEIFKNRQPDFWVFSSSVGNILYGVKFGQVGYNAGHEFLDVFARYKQKQGTRAVTIDWTDWREVGMMLEAIKRGAAGDDAFSISPAEGVEVFLRILQSSLAQVAVSSNDLHALIDHHNNPESNRESPGENSEDHPSPAPKKQKPRRLSTRYTSPRDDLERKTAQLLQKFFTIEKIGIYDDFFELGGDSLKAVQLASLMKKAGIPIHFHQLLLHRNIAEICRNLSQKGQSGMGMEAIEIYLSKKYNCNVYYRSYLSGDFSCRILFITGEPIEIQKVLEDIEKKAAPGTLIYPDFVTFIVPGNKPPESPDANHDVLTELLALKNSVNEEDRNRMLEELNKNSRLTPLLKENTRIRENQVSPVQQSFLIPPYKYISTSFIDYVYDFSYPLDHGKIRDIAAALIQKNSLLRSLIVDRNGSYFIEEFDSFANIHLPFIDISSYSVTCKTEIIARFVQHLSEPMDVLDNVLFRAVVLKINHSHHRLLIILNHLIADGTCVSILDKQLSKLSTGIRETEKKTSFLRDYWDYVEFLKGQNYSNIHLEKYIELREYKDSTDEILEKFKMGSLKHEAFELDISIINEKNKHYYNEVMLLVYARVIGDLFGVEKVPIMYISNGRVYRDGNFNDIIGDFHDNIPVLVTPHDDPQIAMEHFIDYMRFIRENNFNFNNYVYKGHIENFDFTNLNSIFTYNSLSGLYELFKEKRNEQSEKMFKTEKFSYPYFFMGVLEDYDAGKLWLTFLQNSGISIKEIFMKNYSHLVDYLGKKI